MKEKFEIDKIASYLGKYKSNLPTIYKWNTKIDKLVELEILTKNDLEGVNNPYEIRLLLKKKLGQKLNETQLTNKPLFNQLCLWIIREWGRISTGNDKDTTKLITNFLDQDKPDFKRIASTSKVGAYLVPEKYCIYDSRVIYSLNWIILSENAGQKYFPVPQGRNSKMLAFDINVLIRLKNLSLYRTDNISDLNNKRFINNVDKYLFIDKKKAYFEFIKLIKEVSKKLWEDDKEKKENLYFTEMLLFSIADKEIFADITKRWNDLMKIR